MYERAFNMVLYIGIPMFVELFRSVSHKKGHPIFIPGVYRLNKRITDLGVN